MLVEVFQSVDNKYKCISELQFSKSFCLLIPKYITHIFTYMFQLEGAESQYFSILIILLISRIKLTELPQNCI